MAGRVPVSLQLPDCAHQGLYDVHMKSIGGTGNPAKEQLIFSNFLLSRENNGCYNPLLNDDEMGPPSIEEPGQLFSSALSHNHGTFPGNPILQKSSIVQNLSLQPDDLQNQMHNRCRTESVSTNASGSLLSGQSQAVFNTNDSVVCASNNTRKKSMHFKLINFMINYHQTTECLKEHAACCHGNCARTKRFVQHIIGCQNIKCRCAPYRQLLCHYKKCHNKNCNICSLVRKHISGLKYSKALNDIDDSFSHPCPVTAVNPLFADVQMISSKQTFTDMPNISSLDNEFKDHRMLLKCTMPKQESFYHQCAGHSQLMLSNQSTSDCNVRNNKETKVQQPSVLECETTPSPISVNSHFVGFDTVSINHNVTFDDQSNNDKKDIISEKRFVVVERKENSAVHSVLTADASGHYPLQNIIVHKESDEVVQDGKKNTTASIQKNAFKPNPEKEKIKGLSLIEWYTPDLVKEQLRSLRQANDQGNANLVKKEVDRSQFDENMCQLCGISNIYFDAPSIFCHLCNKRIKGGMAYYTATDGGVFNENVSTEPYFCTTCFNKHTIFSYNGSSIPKAKLNKKINNESETEHWVQCDKCSSWQHQVCCLFNDIKNEKDKTEYTCPYCYLRELDSRESFPLPHNTLLGAINLPKSKLSDHIEKRLFTRLKQEREERAKAHGMQFHEVPGAEGLVVRVVSSIDKQLEVRNIFYSCFAEKCYPKKFPYRSKVIMLFQMIGGADICIFAMYVQEYGSDCSSPNQRQVYISYLDSVQHFSPEIKCVTKEALRTFVYQEILIGYLDYCKHRGFTCCYIWSCPSKREEDFILNCHPKKQKMPRHAKLRKWYRSMVKKASDENIIVHATNFYDYFFTQSNGCKSRVTVTRLPYFDGDYWPIQAEIILNNLMDEEESGESKKKLIKRDAKTFKHKQPSEGFDKDALLIDKIGSAIRPMKEDFILAHLQHACNHCSQFIISGNRWICNCCEKFQLCDCCYNIEKTLDEKQKHSASRRGKHIFSPVEIISWPLHTIDEDDIVKSNHFDCRLKFLDLCQRMHYQFDTLRRAKHSTMMILYLHYNSISPNSENRTISQAHPCYQTSRHISNILEHNILRSFLNKCFEVLHIESEHKILWGKDLVKLFHFLDHAAQCRGKGCKNVVCRRLKQLFRHCAKCNMRTVESCRECNVVWLLLKFHALMCDKLACQVPHCIRIRNHRLNSSSGSGDEKIDKTSGP